MNKHKKVFYLLSGIFLVALMVIIIMLGDRGRCDYAQNVAIKACIWIIYLFFAVKYEVRVSNYAHALVMTTVVSDSFLGLYLDLYTTSAVFDKIQHVFGSYAFSFFGYNLICSLTQPTVGRTFSFIFIISLGLGIGALYEIGEFLGDWLFNPKISSQPSLLDTDLDLMADLLGALLAAVHAVIFLPPHDMCGLDK